MRRQRGFSLVEVLVALLILTVVITTSMMAFLERNRRLQQASETMLVYQALANEAEYRRRTPYSTLQGQLKEFVSDTAVLAPLAPYKTSVTATLTKPGVTNVLLAVQWAEGKKEAKLEIVRVDTGGSSFW